MDRSGHFSDFSDCVVVTCPCLHKGPGFISEESGVGKGIIGLGCAVEIVAGPKSGKKFDKMQENRTKNMRISVESSGFGASNNFHGTTIGLRPLP